MERALNTRDATAFCTGVTHMDVKRSLFYLWPLVLGLSMGQVHAQSDERNIDALMELTGFNDLVERVPEFAGETLSQTEGALDHQSHQMLELAFGESYRPELIQQDVEQILTERYQPGPMENYLAILRSPLAQEMAELESTIGNTDEMHAFLDQLESNPPSDYRLALVERLDDANNATGFAVDMHASFFRGVFQALDPMLAPEMRLAEPELESMVQEVKATLEPIIHNATLVTYLYAFRDVSDAQLEQYVALYESPDAKWGVTLLDEAMLQALADAGDRAADVVREQVQ